MTNRTWNHKTTITKSQYRIMNWILPTIKWLWHEMGSLCRRHETYAVNLCGFINSHPLVGSSGPPFGVNGGICCGGCCCCCACCAWSCAWSCCCIFCCICCSICCCNSGLICVFCFSFVDFPQSFRFYKKIKRFFFSINHMHQRNACTKK